MLCVRCSHPLPSGADRCLRCFALNPQNRAATPPPEPRRPAPPLPPLAEEPPSFFHPPVTDPELAAIGLSDPPAAPLRISIESDPPPPSLGAGFSIESEPPEPSHASIASEPPAPSATGPFELAPPASSPRLEKPPRKPGKPRQQPLPLKLPASEGEPAQTLIFAAPPDPEPEELGDIDLGPLDVSGPQAVPPEALEAPTELREPAEATLLFGAPPLAAEPHDTPTEPPAPPAPTPLQLDEAWRVASLPPPALAPPEDLLAAELDFGGAPGALGPNSLLATPLEVESLPGETLALAEPAAPRPSARARGPWAPPGARLASWAVDALLLFLCTALFAVAAVQVVGEARLAPPGFGSADYWLDLVAFGPRMPALWAALLACLALAYSWLFGWAGGRTPGMALAGLRLVPLSGARLSAGRALARAALSLPSAAAGLAGFLFALFDARGQALHDKLTGTAVVRDGASLAAGAART